MALNKQLAGQYMPSMSFDSKQADTTENITAAVSTGL